MSESDRHQLSLLSSQYFHLHEADPDFDSRPGAELFFLFFEYLQTMAIVTVSYTHRVIL